ncbi:hypothetical protein DPX16_5900 [Anabarilius grahami]|uniref:Uncharacterized protein n=1 Tax=Anabarilius grahami TaxID=495550 RepID=A0A3N0Y2Z4_ANAGA|nr:hypothetical protein DPX16_5900 [Anabarilius grahami]
MQHAQRKDLVDMTLDLIRISVEELSRTRRSENTCAVRLIRTESRTYAGNAARLIRTESRTYAGNAAGPIVLTDSAIKLQRASNDGSRTCANTCRNTIIILITHVHKLQRTRTQTEGAPHILYLGSCSI